jgi:hypothetical protein
MIEGEGIPSERCAFSRERSIENGPSVHVVVIPRGREPCVS